VGLTKVVETGEATMVLVVVGEVLVVVGVEVLVD
jgi:hypothetical protein